MATIDWVAVPDGLAQDGRLRIGVVPLFDLEKASWKQVETWLQNWPQWFDDHLVELRVSVDGKVLEPIPKALALAVGKHDSSDAFALGREIWRAVMFDPEHTWSASSRRLEAEKGSVERITAFTEELNELAAGRYRREHAKYGNDLKEWLAERARRVEEERKKENDRRKKEKETRAREKKQQEGTGEKGGEKPTKKEEPESPPISEQELMRRAEVKMRPRPVEPQRPKPRPSPQAVTRRVLPAAKEPAMRQIFAYQDSLHRKQAVATADLLRGRYFAAAPGILGFAGATPIGAPAVSADPDSTRQLVDASTVSRETPRTPSEAQAWATRLGADVASTAAWDSNWGDPGDYLRSGISALPGLLALKPAGKEVDLELSISVGMRSFSRYLVRVGGPNWAETLTETAASFVKLAAFDNSEAARRRVADEAPWVRYLIDNPIEPRSVGADKEIDDLYSSRSVEERVGQLRSNPGLLRFLRLVVNVYVPSASVRETGELAVEPVFTNPPFASVARITKYLHSEAVFVPKPNDAHPAEKQDLGLIKVRDKNETYFDLRTTDFNTQLIAATAAVSAAAGEHRSGVAGAFNDLSTRAATTSGLVLCRTSAALSRRTQEASKRIDKKVNKSDPLYAQDLTIGYRLDVAVYHESRWDWHSACHRGLWYEVFQKDSEKGISVKQSTEDDRLEEAYIRQGGRAPADDPLTLIVGEELCVWRGWNLMLPPPDTIEFRDGSWQEVTLDQGLRSVPPACTPRMDTVRIKAHYKPAAMVPLRFGELYRVALRAAYLNGGGPSLEDARSTYDGSNKNDFVLTLGGAEAKRFSRSEKLRPPEIILCEPPSPKLDRAPRDLRCDPATVKSDFGEQFDRLVVRTADDRELEHRTTRRAVVPARESMELAEITGMFDLDEAALAGALHSSFRLDPETGNIATLEDLLGKDEAKKRCYSDSEMKMPIAQFRSGSKPKRPYYPDPWSHYIGIGVVNEMRPCLGEPAEPHALYDATRAWPNAQPFLIELAAAGSGECANGLCNIAWHSQRHGIEPPALRIQLMPGREARLALWSMPPYPQASGAFRNWEDLEPARKYLKHEAQACFAAGISDTSSLCETALTRISDSECNPTRYVTVIHAVQRPTSAPAFGQGFRLARSQPNDLTAVFEGEVAVDRPSTARLTCQARWEDIIDDIAVEQPQVKEFHHRMFAVDHIAPISSRGERVDLASTDNGEDREIEFDFRDTRRRELSLELTAVSRYSNYFPELKGREGAFERRSEERHRVTVLSSARPAAPRISYIVPTLDWRERRERSHVELKRKGGTVRVWLDRPWFSSGTGEMLAVVCWPAHAMGDSGPTAAAVHETIRRLMRLKASPISGSKIGPDLPTTVEPFVTRIGQDPLWPGGRLMEVLPQGAFPNALHRSNLTLPDLEQAGLTDRVSIAAYPIDYKVQYDKMREQYWCDIEVDPDVLNRDPRDPARWPFVRFAFARYQPESLPGVELSAVTVADMAQLAPHRTASLSYVNADATTVSLHISGFGATDLEANGNWLRYCRDSKFVWSFMNEGRRGLKLQIEVRELLRGFDEDNLAGWACVSSTDELLTVGAELRDVGGAIEAHMTLSLPQSVNQRCYAVIVREREVYSTSDLTLGERPIFSAQLKLYRSFHEWEAQTVG